MTFGRYVVLCAALVVSLASMASTMLDANGWARRSRMAREVLTAKTQTDALEERVQRMRRQINALATRREVQEHVVREELGYVRPTDVVLRFGN